MSKVLYSYTDSSSHIFYEDNDRGLLEQSVTMISNMIPAVSESRAVSKTVSLSCTDTTNHPRFHLLTYLLTYSMVQSPSWEANWFGASHEIPRISWNLKVHYRTHKRPPPVPILGRPNPVHIPTSHVLEIHPNIIHPSKPRSPQWALSLQFPHQDPVHPPLLTHMHHMPSPSPKFYYTSQNKNPYQSKLAT